MKTQLLAAASGASQRPEPSRMRVLHQWVSALVLVLLTLPAAAQSQDYTWTTNSDGTTLTTYGYYGPGGDVIMPGRLPDTNGLPVTAIGMFTFSGCTDLRTITIPNGVTSIGTWAFGRCINLTSISIPDTLTTINYNAFYYCPSLTSISIPNRVTAIWDRTFYQCSSLTNASIGTNVTRIGGEAFAYCSSLMSLTIPNNVTNIGAGAFASCSKLTSAIIGTNVTTIGISAFAYCSSLTSVSIPNSVTTIGVAAFSSCFSLTNITVEPLNLAYSSLDGVLFDGSQTTLIQYPAGIAGGYAIPNRVTNIEDWAFSSCLDLTSIAIPDNVTSIGDRAFRYCTSLTALYFRGAPPALGVSVFDGDSQPTVYYLPGTTGWGATVGGPSTPRPTALWQPQMLTRDTTLGLQTNQFGFNIAWSSGMPFAVDACTDLANPTWLPLQTNTLTADTNYFTDPDWTNSPRRYYRIRWP